METYNSTLQFNRSSFSIMLKQVRQMADESLILCHPCRYSVSIVSSPNPDTTRGERFKSFDLEEESSMFDFLNDHPRYEAECDLYYKDSDESSWERSEIGIHLKNSQISIYN